jgi:hypothetical protein
MTQDRHLLFAILGGIGAVLLGAAVLVWPNMRATHEAEARIAELRKKIVFREAHAERVDRVAEELEVVRAQVDDDLRFIPESPDIAQLMRVLSLPVDGRTVLDQTFTAGSGTEAAVGSDFSELATLLTVEMQATFDSTFALLRAAELMDRLVRVSSVHLVTDRTAGDDDQMPMLSASIGLEVIYDPPSSQETGR